ncbi:MAG: hypothetical protein JWO36_3360 [Myxococcales bacterium]|nr:hypothetical protein [Myxococcales bacterium]
MSSAGHDINGDSWAAVTHEGVRNVWAQYKVLEEQLQKERKDEVKSRLLHRWPGNALFAVLGMGSCAALFWLYREGYSIAVYTRGLYLFAASMSAVILLWGRAHNEIGESEPNRWLRLRIRGKILVVVSSVTCFGAVIGLYDERRSHSLEQRRFLDAEAEAANQITKVNELLRETSSLLEQRLAEMKRLIGDDVLTQFQAIKADVEGLKRDSRAIRGATDLVKGIKSATDNIAAVKSATDNIAEIKIATDSITGIKTATDNIKTATDSIAGIKSATDNIAGIKTATDNIKTATDSIAGIKSATDNIAAIKTTTDNIAGIKTTTDSIKTATDNIAAIKTATDSIAAIRTATDNIAGIKAIVDQVAGIASANDKKQ